MTLDQREKEYETNPISHNSQGINGLQRVSSTAGSANLTDRSSSIRADTDLRVGARGTATGQRRTIAAANQPDSRSNGSSEMTKQSQFLITPINPATYTEIHGG